MPRLLQPAAALVAAAIVCWFLPETVRSQSIPIGSIEDEQIRLHILTTDSVSVSTVNRPLSRYSYNRIMKKYGKNGEQPDAWWMQPLSPFETDLPMGFRAGIHAPWFQTTFNSLFPVSENNAAAWYGRGFNPEISGGVYLTSRYLTIDLQPHLVYQQNRDYLEPRFTSTDADGNQRYISEGIGDRIDLPYRFGPDPFFTFDRGYSSVRLHYKQVEAGISSEPLHWGPSLHYPLMMSRNAPGIDHAFIGTRERLPIPYIGDVQFRWIVGYPEESDFYDGNPAGNTRFMNAINVAYSPAFLKELTIGATRTFQMYETDGFAWDNVTLMFQAVRLSQLDEEFQTWSTRQHTDQAISIYAEWLLSETGGRIYGEFFKEDHNYDSRDLINQPHHNSAWALGFEKTIQVPFLDILLFNTEITNLTITQLQQVRFQDYYYTHGGIRHGHTNRGHILGAAIGPGSNSQLISFEGYRNNWKAGFLIQRMVDNDNFHFITTTRGPGKYGDYFRHRVNLNIGGELLYQLGPLYLHSKILWTKAYNYGRFDYGQLDGITVTNYDRNDLSNVQFQLGVRYAF